MGRPMVSAALACALLAGCASEQPAPETPPAPLAAGHSQPEDSPEKLRAMSCSDLDQAMAANLGVTFIAQTSGNIIDDAIAKESVRKFKLVQKEYKSRCKGEPVQLKAMRKSHSPSKYLPE